MSPRLRNWCFEYSNTIEEVRKKGRCLACYQVCGRTEVESSVIPSLMSSWFSWQARCARCQRYRPIRAALPNWESSSTAARRAIWFWFCALSKPVISILFIAFLHVKSKGSRPSVVRRSTVEVLTLSLAESAEYKADQRARASLLFYCWWCFYLLPIRAPHSSKLVSYGFSYYIGYFVDFSFDICPSGFKKLGHRP